MSDALQAEATIFEQLSAILGERKSPKHIEFNCLQAFHGIDLRDKTVLEIGAGEGVLSAYATRFARHVTAIEPEGAGSTKGYSSTIQRMQEALGVTTFDLIRDTVQNYDGGESKYDIVLMHNVVNHLDECMCERLHHSSEAKGAYRDICKHIARMMSRRAKLIICDCSRHNVFSMINMKHPITPQIEWNKHQAPGTWVRLLEPLGFAKEDLSWTVAYPLRKFTPVLKNCIAAFFLFSHFRLVLSLSHIIDNPE